MKKRILSFLLCFCLLFSVFPTAAMAADTAVEIVIGTDGKPTEASGTGWSYDGSTATLTLNRGYAFTLTGSAFTGTVNNYGTITDGVFNGTVNNTSDTKSTSVAGGTINGGTFHGTVNNYHGWGTCTINDGTFNGTVNNGNHGVINGGTFNGAVETNMLGNKVNGGNFKLTLVLGDDASWIYSSAVPAYYQYSTAAVALPTGENINAPDGYKFDGWYSDTSFSGTAVTVIPAKSTTSLTYYARFVEAESITSWSELGEAAVADTDYTVDPSGNYTVKTPAGLAYIANLVNGGDDLSGKTVTLANDIDLYDGGVSGYADGGTVIEANSWIPIEGFAGVFDGNDKSISNLYVVTTSEDAGLFGANSGTIKNLELVSGKITINLPDFNDTSEYHAGGIAATSSGLIENCINRAAVHVNTDGMENIYLGGIAGLVISTGKMDVAAVRGCSNYGTISSSGSATGNNIYGGGVVGGLTSGGTVTLQGHTSLIDGCYNGGAVSLQAGYSSYAGGIVGKVSTAGSATLVVEVRNSENHRTVSGDFSGGIAGFSQNNVLIANNFNWSSVTGSNSAGGIVGFNYGSSATVENCYNIGAVTDATNIGGVVGKNTDGTVRSGYYLDTTASDVTGTNTGTISDSYAFSTNGTTHTFTNSASESVELIDALNSWVDNEQSTLYLSWIADTGNSAYPIFGETWELSSIVWVGGQGMTASTDGSIVSYYTNGTDGAVGTVTQTEPDEYHAKLYYDTAASAYTLWISGLDAVGINEDTDSLGAGIYTTVPLTIDVNGENTVTGGTFGVVENNNLTYKQYGNAYGLYAVDNLTVEGTGTFTVNAPDVMGSSYALYSEKQITVESSTLLCDAGATININSNWNFWSVGIYAKSLVINGGEITASGDAATRRSVGVYVTETITVSDGKITGTSSDGVASGRISAYSEGIYAVGDITVNGGTVVGNSGYGGTTSHGIRSDYNITINDGTVSGVSGGSGSDQSRGIFAGADATEPHGTLVIKKGTVTGVAGNSSEDFSQGIGAYDGITISGGSVNATGGQGLVSVGLYSDWDLTISGGAQIYAEAASANVYSYGTWCWRNFHMSDNESYLNSKADITTGENTTSRPRRSIGFYMSDGYYESDPPYVDDTFVITGGTFEAMCTTSDESTSLENYALKMYDVIDNSVVFSDPEQTNETWYLWTLDADGDTENEYRSYQKAYVHDDAEENYKSRYLYIAPTSMVHEVTFNSMGGSEVEPNPVKVEDGEPVAAPNPAPTKEGYAFAGWYTSKNDGETLADEPYDFNTPVTSNFTLYAKWIPVYSVTYDLNGGTGADGVDYSAETVPVGTEITVKEAPTRNGYTFTGWSDGATTYQPGATITVNSNITLTAQWEEIPQYTVTYDLNGGTGADGVDYSAETVPVGTEINVKEAPTRNGYTFTGWSDGATTYQPGVTITVNSDITLTAQWEKNEVPVDPPVIIPIGSVELTKVDAQDHTTVLSGVVFDLYRANGTKVGAYTTDSNGKIKVSSLSAGNYYWKEVRSAEGYVLDSTEHPFTVSIYKTTYLVIENAKSDVPEVFTHDHYAYIIGYDDGLVHPEANITRAEVATIFFRLLDEETRNLYMTRENDFSDVTSDKWYNTAVSTMAAMGIVTGRPGGIFDPNANITRAEFAAIAARFDANGNTTGASFTDIYDHWAQKEINIAANNGWVLGYEDGTFRPDQYITRAEAMTMVNRVLQRIPEDVDDLLPDMVQWPDNMDTTKWYYLMVQEATNSHYYIRKENGYESWTELREVPDWAELER